MNAQELARRLTSAKNRLPAADRDRLILATGGVHDLPQNDDSTLKVWNPSEKAVTPHPQCPKVRATSNWDEAKALARFHFDRKPIVLFGAGSSTLRHDLKPLLGLPVMGINWTLKWFEPTYLHILDKQPFRTQIIENPSQQAMATQVITANQTRDRFREHGLKIPVLGYETKDDSCGKYPSFRLAFQGSDLFQHFPNSLGFALQAATALGFRKIILMGFDFGGFHFFGDGRSVGCASHYGEMGEMKRYLHPLLMAQAHAYLLRGVRVVHVGPTELPDCYPVVASLEDALGRV